MATFTPPPCDDAAASNALMQNGGPNVTVGGIHDHPSVCFAAGAPLVDPGEEGEVATEYTGVTKQADGRFSARIPMYLGSFETAEEAARCFDAKAIESGRPVETINFPAAYKQAPRKRKVHRLFGDPHDQVSVLLRKLADVDRSKPGILRLTMGSLGVPDSRFLADNEYAGIRKKVDKWEARVRVQDKLYSMGLFASPEAAALAWDITAGSLRISRYLNFPEVLLADLEQQLDALKCVIAGTPPANAAAAAAVEELAKIKRLPAVGAAGVGCAAGMASDPPGGGFVGAILPGLTPPPDQLAFNENRHLIPTTVEEAEALLVLHLKAVGYA